MRFCISIVKSNAFHFMKQNQRFVLRIPSSHAYVLPINLNFFVVTFAMNIIVVFYARRAGSPLTTQCAVMHYILTRFIAKSMRFPIFILKPNAFLLDPPYGKEIRQTKINLFLQFFLPFCPMKFEFMIKNQRKKRIRFTDKNAKTHCI